MDRGLLQVAPQHRDRIGVHTVQLSVCEPMVYVSGQIGHPRRKDRVFRWVLAVGLLMSGAQSASPQVVTGRVVDGQAAAVRGATIEVVGTVQRVVADSRGAFRLHLGSGDWQVMAWQIGYRSDTAAVTLSTEDSAHVVLRLRQEAIRLRGISARVLAAPGLEETVTRQTVRQVPPLGEADVFRAVSVLPLVSQPNDLKGRIHLAGGSSDETGTTLDGHPLQDPFHLLGTLGAFNVAALDRADIRIHHMAPSKGGRLSGTIDLTTLGPAAELSGEVVTGLLSSGATVAAPIGSRVDLLASGRVTYIDKILDNVDLPDVPGYGFEDGLVRVGVGERTGRVEFLVFHTRDHTSLPDDELTSSPYQWGETLFGVRARRRLGRLLLTARASVNKAVATRATVDGTEAMDLGREWRSFEVEGRWELDRTRVDVGVSLDNRRNRQSWSLSNDAREIFSSGVPETFAGADTLTHVAGWVRFLWTPLEAWRLDLGVRADLVPSLGRPRASPRLALRHELAGGLTVEAAYDRRYQFDAQAAEPPAGSISPPLFLLPDGRRADVLGAGLVYRKGSASTSEVRLDAFHKTYADRPVLADTASMRAPFPTFQRRTGRASGISVRGRVDFTGTGAVLQGSYTFQRVRLDYPDGTYPTVWDAPHTLLLFGSVPVGRKWTVNGLYRAHSGRAITPIRGVKLVQRSGTNSAPVPVYPQGSRNSARVDPYHRVDVGVRKVWEHGWLSANWTLAVQILNLFNNRNPTGLDWPGYIRAARDPLSTGSGEGRKPGLPFLPSVGLEVRW